MIKRLILSLFMLLFSVGAIGAEIIVKPEDSLQAALDKAKAQDIVKLQPGLYTGNFIISTAITVKGEEGVILDALGKGSVLTVKASKVKIEDLTLQNFGKSLYDWDSGVLIAEGAEGVTLKNLNINGPSFGIRADKTKNLLIEGCVIKGDKKIHVLDRGDGVFFKYVVDSELRNNKVYYTRDGFYFEDCDRIQSHGNYFAGLQYGIHFMYDRDDSAWNNKAEAVRGGYAIMNSDRITLFNNDSSRTIEFGILMNVTNGSKVYGNTVKKAVNPRGRPELDNEGKGLFIYGPGKNEVYGNSFADSDIGVSVAMGGEGTLLWENIFSDNHNQVRYVGNGGVEWSKDGKGNYWSNYQGWDLNEDGVGDTPYQPNDSLDRLFWLYPEARFLMESPVVVLLRFLSSQFELDRGKGVTDSHPLMHRPSQG